MITITEDYVSFETAKLLKEKGFIENCIMRYNRVGDLVEEAYKFNWNFQTIDYSAPTLQIVMKWLRKVYNIHIAVDRGPKGYHLSIQTIPLGIVKYITREITGNTYVNSYEEAVEAAIKYCLENLI